MNCFFKTEIFTPIEEKSFVPLSKNEIRELRKNRLKEIEMFEIIYDIFLHFMFFWILYVVCYSNTNSATFRSQKHMKEIQWIFMIGLVKFLHQD